MRTRKLIPTMKFVWHGGEPLVLPDDYLQNLYVELDAAFGPAARHKQYVDTAVQTNLYSISQQKIEFISQHRIGVGVSFDYVSGVRVSVAGKASERRVLDNMRLLREAGIEFGLITVLAQHNKTRLREAYDFFRRENIQRVRILPLFKGPAERSDHGGEALLLLRRRSLVNETRARVRDFTDVEEEREILVVADVEPRIGALRDRSDRRVRRRGRPMGSAGSES